MAYRFGDQLVPGGALIKLRLVLLISLVLNPQKRLLHILAVGGETGIAMSLLQYAQKFSQRSFPAGAGNSLCGKVTTDGCHSWIPYLIQGGVLPLCSGGVYLSGDLGSWKKQSKDQLQAILAGNKIFFDLASKYTGGMSQQLTYSLQCHIWGTYSPLTSPVKAIGQRDDDKHCTSTGDLTKSFLDAFSFICFLDAGSSSVDEEISTQICYHHLAWWSGAKVETVKTSIHMEDMERYLSIARQIEPTLTPAADALIQSYHASVRLARSSGFGTSDVPNSGISSLLGLATGFSKLRLSSFVEETDALMAAHLYEESLVSRLGFSILNVQPQPHILDSCIPSFLGKQNDIEMQKFQAQLLRFCARAFDSRLGFKEE